MGKVTNMLASLWGVQQVMEDGDCWEVQIHTLAEVVVCGLLDAAGYSYGMSRTSQGWNLYSL